MVTSKPNFMNIGYRELLIVMVVFASSMPMVHPKCRAPLIALDTVNGRNKG